MLTFCLGLLLAVVSATAVRAYQQTRAANAQLALLASHDYLTGLLNRRAWDDLLEREIRRAARNGASLAVIMADVDLFKKYNDHYGHQAGDECLRKVAEQFRAATRRPGDAAGRYGGEEFCVVLPDTDEAAAREIADRIRGNIEAMGLPHELHPAGHVTASFGVASANFSQAGGDAGPGLVAMADKALYAAKAAGRNRVGSADQGGTPAG